jgi:hypothetical protein
MAGLDRQINHHWANFLNTDATCAIAAMPGCGYNRRVFIPISPRKGMA